MSSIHAFHGADGKTGTTMITQCVAEYIASNRKEVKVMAVSIHGRPGTEYVDRVTESIEGIKLYLDNRLLDIQRLMAACKKTDNLYILGGVESIEHVRSYHPEMAAYLLEKLRETFDLVLADTGNDIDNGLAFGALECIEDRYCIITQQESILKRYERLKSLYDRLGLTFSSHIVNKYSHRHPCDIRYIIERLVLEKSELLKVEASEYGWQAESEHRTLLSYRNDTFSSDIRSIANRILSNARIDTIEDGRKKKWTLSI